MTVPTIADDVLAYAIPELEKYCELNKRDAEVLDIGYGELRALLSERRQLIAQRDAILQQARDWACEAKTQQEITKEVGAILGGIPDWGPIAEGVAELKQDAERYRFLKAKCDTGLNEYLETNVYQSQWDEYIDTAMQEQTP